MNIINEIDITHIKVQPYNTIYKFFVKSYKPIYEPDDKLIISSSVPISLDILQYIQEAAQLIDISNNFILIQSPNDILNDLTFIRKNYSCDKHDIEHKIIQPFNSLMSYESISNIPKILPDNFCFYPWVNLEISSQGNFKPCCIYDGYLNNLNISSHSIEDAYFSNELSTLREKFISGEYPEKCIICWNNEKHNNTSTRLLGKSKFDLEARLLSLEKETIKNILSFDIKLGIECNLKCRICSPSSSSKILTEQILISNSTFLNNIKRNSNFAKNITFWDMFDPYIETLKFLEFYGGEPLIIHNHKILLDKIIAKNKARNILIHYNTNGTFFPERLINTWNNFKEVNIAFSIDDINERFEYQRSNASWNIVTQNISKFFTLGSNYSFSLFISINSQNVFYLPELLNWWYSLTDYPVHINIISYPLDLNIQYLSYSTKEKIINKLSNSCYTNKFKGIINVLQNPTTNNTDARFKKFMYKLDKIRSESFSKTHPEFANIINYD